ncbi:hypothetical protein EC988_004948 [Linderina pennispora]|nr:hypothetical protein EC988_004948 [Linderina pennispora]
MHGTLGSNTSNDDGVVMATASLDSLVAGNAMVGIGDAGQGGGDANALISGSSLAGLTAGITSVAQTPLLASAASAPTPHPAGPLLSPNCPGSDTASPGQYQLLNDLLLQCNAFDFLNNAGFGSSDMQNSVNGTSMAAGIVQFGQQQIQPSSDELSPCASSAPAIPSTSGAESAACTSFDNGFGDISIASAESLFSDTSALASAVAAAYMHNEDAPLSSACSTSGPPTDSSVTPPHTHVKCDGAAATASSSAEDSFTVGSISSSRAMDTPLAAVLSQKQGANHLPLHSAAQTSLGPGSMPKVGSNTSVVVATSNRLILQRDPLVEQIYTESLQF